MSFLASVLNLLFPPRCASCKKEGDFLCQNCIGKLKIHKIRSVSVRPSKQEFAYLDGVIYGLDYADNPGIQAAIKQFKYHFTQDLADHFGELLAKKLKQLGMLSARNAVLIPVPLHKKRLGQRGFNQAELIAKNTASRMGKRAQVNSLLSRIKNTSQQAKLKVAERHRNLEGAFQLTGNLSEIQNKVCFLVDDVCTTGATLDSCASLLKKMGASKVYGLVVARAFK